MQLSVDGIVCLFVFGVIPPHLVKNELQVILLSFPLRMSRGSIGGWILLVLGLMVSPILLIAPIVRAPSVARFLMCLRKIGLLGVWAGDGVVPDRPTLQARLVVGEELNLLL